MHFSKGDILVPKENQYPEGALVVDGCEGGRVAAHPLGGGFQLYLSSSDLNGFRPADEAEKARVLFRRANFALGESKDVFAGWTDGRLWNGWAMPRFELAEAQRLIAWLGDKRASYDEVRDAFLTVSQEGDEETWPAESIVVSDGGTLKVYPIGAGAWIWDDAGQ